MLDQTWTEVVPFCFQALYDLAPAARRVEREVPNDPFELSAWPIRRLGARRAQVRYQFHTRDLEMVALIRALSRARPSLTFTLATLCYDDSSVEAARFARGRAERWIMRERDCEPHWDRARRKFNLPDDEVYMDDEAEHWTEQEMLHAALIHWDRRGGRSAGRRREWHNRFVLRDLETERELAMYEVAEFLGVARRKTRGRPKRGRSSSRK